MSDTVLDPATEVLVRLSAALAAWTRGACREDDVRWALRLAGDEAGAEAVEEALLQSYLFLGYPASLNALALWREVQGGAGSDAPPPEDEGANPGGPPGGPDRQDRTRRGEEVCATVYGGQYGALRENVRALHPEMEGWMVEEGYGKVLGRPGLSLTVRELCIVALLAVSDWPTQLYSHLRGALNAGASEDEVVAALEMALGPADEDTRRRARKSWARLRDRTGG